jgi:D-alanine-D-alanine ligase-like ATP-grasp enzyme
MGPTYTDSKTFGKFEPGNKVYYEEMDEYFSQDLRFSDKPKLFSETLAPEFKARALLAFKACSESVAREAFEVGFELLGFDFMVDEQLDVYLIEVNTNPCLSTLSEPQGVLINKLLADTMR